MENSVIQEGKNIKYIYHSADIHIRTLERHAEYRQVFQNLYKKMTSSCTKEELRTEAVFVICGDIFHSRDKLAPETIIIFDEFMKNLTSIIDVIIITGNHDTFPHPDRLDIISGILDIKHYPNLYYLKNSGHYIYNNICFGVSSLIDNKFTECLEKYKKEYTCVALYHGGLSGSVLDNGVLIGSGVPQSKFVGYDLVLLGDFHKKQFLKENIAYPGSLIQQNFGEELIHGILKWNVKTITSEFIQIHNDYGYIKVKENDIETTSFPKYSRIKLVHRSTDFDESKIKNIIRKKTKILSFNKVINFEEKKDVENTVIKAVDELAIFNNLIKKHDKYTKEQLMIVNEAIYSELSESRDKLDQTKCLDWSVSELQFKNVYIYGEDNLNTINFENLNGITGIIANNASGKSSIINILLYSIFGSTTKTKSYLNRNIINKNSKKYFIKIKIKVGESDTFVITRTGKNKSRKNKSASMDELLEFESSKQGNLGGSTKVVTQENINKILGIDSSKKELFLLTNVLNHTNYASLLNMTSSDISNVFTSLFEMSHFKFIQDSILKKTKLVTNKITELNNKISSLQDVSHDSVYDTTLEIPEKMTSDELTSLVGYPDITPENVLENTETLSELNKKIDLYKGKIVTGYDFTESSETLESLENEKNNITFEKIPVSCYSEQEYIFSKKYYTGYLENVRYLKELNNDTSIDNTKIAFVLDLLENIDTFINSRDTVNSYEKRKNDISDNQEKMKNYQNLCEKINYVCNKHLEHYKCLKLKCIQTNKFSGLVKKEKQDKYAKNEILKELGDNIQKKINVFELELDSFKKTHEVYKIYKELFCNKGIPKMVLSGYIETLENKTNNIIYPLCGFTICINNTDDEKWEICFKKQDMILGSEQLSGYQKFIVDIAIKVSLDFLKYRGHGSIFIVDESADCVSQDNLDNIDTIFDFLRSRYTNVLFVSHNEQLKLKVDSRIEISTDFISSKIK
jgi:DNA repair exonuclease SbcCD nuclease subunit